MPASFITHVCMSHGTHMHESWHTYEWVMAHVWMSLVTRMDESCHTYGWVMSHIWTSHVTHEWVMSHIWTSHVTHEWVMSPIWTSHVMHCRWSASNMLQGDEDAEDSLIHKRGIHSRALLQKMTYKNKESYASSPSCILVVAHLSHVTRMNESCHTCEQVMSHLWMSHVTLMNESCHTYEWVLLWGGYDL